MWLKRSRQPATGVNGGGGSALSARASLRRLSTVASISGGDSWRTALRFEVLPTTAAARARAVARLQVVQAAASSASIEGGTLSSSPFGPTSFVVGKSCSTNSAFRPPRRFVRGRLESPAALEARRGASGPGRRAGSSEIAPCSTPNPDASRRARRARQRINTGASEIHGASTRSGRAASAQPSGHLRAP